MSFTGSIVLCKSEGHKFSCNVLCENVVIIIIRVLFFLLVNQSTESTAMLNTP